MAGPRGDGTAPLSSLLHAGDPPRYRCCTSLRSSPRSNLLELSRVARPTGYRPGIADRGAIRVSLTDWLTTARAHHRQYRSDWWSSAYPIPLSTI